MRLINVETLKLEEFFDDKIPPYAILSHTWGDPGEEVTFSDIEAEIIEKPGNGTMKLKGCCNQAKDDNLGYAWIDTCCINKDSSRELDEAINSMFQWYRKASICYAYLSDVPPGDNSWDSGSKFFASRWFLRGWTLQELLAPKKLCFYDQTWKSIGRKEDISNEIETITGIPQQFLLGWEDLRKASVAQRMSWDAKRKTTRKEDIAYCLLGIFDVAMSMIYGEGDRALSRLQQEIMKNTGDHSILAWGLNAAESIPSKSTDVVSAGILATAPADFANCGPIVLRKQDATPVDTFDISGGHLRVHISLHTPSAGEIYGLLNCGPEHNTEQVVGIPLRKVVSGDLSDKYLRPQGHYPVLLSKTASTGLTKAIHIRMERQNRAQEATSRRYWLRINGHQKINLKLSGVHPPANDSDEIITRQYLTRFYTPGEGSRDFVAQARCHIMTLSRDTTLEALSQKLIYMRPEAFGKQTASNDSVNVKEPVFITTVDATLELQQVDLKFEFLRILQEEDQRDEKMAALDSMRDRLAVVEENLRKLMPQQVDQLKKRHYEAMQRQHKLSERGSEIQRRLDEVIKTRLDAGQIGRSLKDLSRMTPLSWAAAYGHEAVAKLLLEKGADVEAKTNDDWTPLRGAATSGHEAVVKLLLERGADVEAKDNNGWTPLRGAAYNGHEAVENNGWTPLRVAAANEHEAVVKLLLERGAGLHAACILRYPIPLLSYYIPSNELRLDLSYCLV
ncbi:hypothetical protein BU23DRAFT_590811 [Bimuria novae-zelandiae CBS 107.79]|uniref:Heterokaryon incompatibility domain-containing protein n=1 Tax=Bimuria novae-zelandiae CBS 107.79 TaxID=1447943 RepID=A0A6A5V4E9_9PLEO|nr:hypothetical protein BU23DRAFT_590811 [Bimuria novae-zelandiae CBS 107.79]